MSDRLELSRNDQASRYEGRLDGEVVALADFEVAQGLVVIPHTWTEPAHRGHGFAAQVVAFALDDIASQGRQVLPSCPYVRDYIAAHPDYAALLPG